MCGIAGLVGHKLSPDLIGPMLNCMVHRGPDGRGLWNDPEAGVVLGHLRLAIIDLATGDQPMFSPDKRHVIVFNGEIFNYLELRPSLEARGWIFRTTSDTEVLLAGLVFEGPEFLRKTVGMFAFALWDSIERRLLLARDRMGIKPLYVAETPSGLAFASELKSLLHIPGVSHDIDLDALEGYLALRYVPSPLTMVRGIRKFPAAHYGWFENGHMSTTRWWDINFTSRPGPLTREDEERLDWHLKDAVRLCLRSDVPYGAFLSGGIDSGVVAGLMCQMSPACINTYSVGFRGVPDELEDAASAARQLGTVHHELEFVPDDFRRLPQIVRLIDEPFPDPIVLAMSMLAERAAKDVKVILTGEGADELFGGYVHHKHLMQLANSAAYMPQAALNLAAGISRRIPMLLLKKVFDYPAPPGPEARLRLAELLRVARSEPKRYLTYISLFSDDDRQKLLSNFGHSEGIRHVTGDLLRGNGSFIDRLLRSEHKNWLVDNILLKQDKTLMAHSVEGRVPFCDHRLVEIVAKMPLSARFGANGRKAALRDSARRLVPALPRSNRKRAFMIPQDGPYAAAIRELSGDLLTSSRFRSLGIFRRNAIDSLLQKLDAPSLLSGKQGLALTMFALWDREVLSKQ